MLELEKEAEDEIRKKNKPNLSDYEKKKWLEKQEREVS